jgi:hypothetical protein
MQQGHNQKIAIWIQYNDWAEKYDYIRQYQDTC